MLTAFLFILLGLGLLIYGADQFVTGAASIARSMEISPLIIGLTIVGLATSMPEILVSMVAALAGKTEIAIGNAIGSNIANIGLVLGGTVLCLPIVVASEALRREYGLMCLAIVLTLLLFLDNYLGRLDATILFICLISFIGAIVWIAKNTQRSDPLVDEFIHELAEPVPICKSVILLIVGLGLLLGGAELLVRGSVIIAKHYGMTDLVIGLTIIAVGTSLPELATSIASVIKKEVDIAIGNVIGSNMFNMLAVLSIPALINPTEIDSLVLIRDFPVMIGLTLLMGWMVFIYRHGKLERIEGLILMLCFIGYQYWLFTSINAVTN
jgi:cation:H+ antiporter